MNALRMTLANESGARPPAVFAVARPPDAKSRARVERRSIVLAADAHALFSVIAERIHGGHAERRIEAKLLNDLIVDRQSAVAAVEMAVRVDEARDDDLAGDVDPRRAGRNLQRCRGTDAIDAPVADEQRRIRDRRSAGAVNNSRADERDRRRRAEPRSDRQRTRLQPK